MGAELSMAEVRTHGSVLQELRGGGRECPPEARALLLENTDRWSPNDLGPAACPVDDKDDVAALWSSIFDDIAGEEEDTPIGCPENFLPITDGIASADLNLDRHVAASAA